MTISAFPLERGKSLCALPIGVVEQSRGWLLGGTYIPIDDSIEDKHWHLVTERFFYRKDGKDKAIVRAYRRRSAVLIAAVSTDYTVDHVTLDNVRYYDRLTCPGNDYRDGVALQASKVNVFTLPPSGWMSDVKLDLVSIDTRAIAPVITRLLPHVKLPATELLTYADLMWCLKRDYLAEATNFASRVRGPR